MASEVARYWQHAAVSGVDLLRARFITHRYGRHAHETYTFGLIEAGVEEFEYDGALLRAAPGDIALLNPDVVHTGQAATPAGWTYRVLYPQVSVVTDIAAELGWGRGTPRFPQTVLHDPASAAMLRRAHQAAEHGDQLASSTLLSAALARLLRAHATVGRAGLLSRGVDRPELVSRAPASVQVARALLRERLADPPSLIELAATTGLSQFALLRAFSRETGLPPHAYLNQLRVRRARLLLDGGLAPADVAAATGFADQAHLPGISSAWWAFRLAPTSASGCSGRADGSPGRDAWTTRASARTFKIRCTQPPTLAAMSVQTSVQPTDRQARPVRDGVGLGLAVGVSGIAFGAAAVSSGLSAWQACALSLLAFTGASQFALAGVIAAGGGLAAGTAGAILLGSRNTLYGLRLAEIVRSRFPARLLVALGVIDETTAVTLAQPDPDSARRAFTATFVTLYLTWNVATLAGALGAGHIGSPQAFGLDVVGPAAFLALIYPRLRAGRTERLVALAGVAIALGTTTVLPVGVPVILAATGALAGALASPAASETPQRSPR